MTITIVTAIKTVAETTSTVFEHKKKVIIYKIYIYTTSEHFPFQQNSYQIPPEHFKIKHFHNISRIKVMEQNRTRKIQKEQKKI
jgi:hypothetical protein